MSSNPNAKYRYVICAEENTMTPQYFAFHKDVPHGKNPYSYVQNFLNAELIMSLDAAVSVLGRMQECKASYFGGDYHADELVAFFSHAKVRKVKISISFEDCEGEGDVKEITWNNFLRLPTNEWSSYDGIKVPPEFKYAIVDNQHIYFTKLEPVLKPITEGSTVHAWWIDSDDKSNVIKGPCLLAKRLCLVKHPDMNTTCIKRD